MKSWNASKGDIAAILASDHRDPFAILGCHEVKGGAVVRAFLPDAVAAAVLHPASGAAVDMEKRDPSGFFEAFFKDAKWFRPTLRLTHQDATSRDVVDLYSFAPWLGEQDLYFHGEGSHLRAYERLGAQPTVHEGVSGVAFAVWAPTARRVSLVGDFNAWDGRRHLMRVRGNSGVWELFVPGIGAGEVYKYEIRSAEGKMLLKADPYGQCAEPRPKSASVVWTTRNYEWHDQAWLEQRAKRQPQREPMSIYEVHLGSWRRLPEDGNRSLSYREAAVQLADYVTEMGYTHVELMPIAEHPFGGSWGYQVTDFFAPTRRFGWPDEFAWFIDYMHQRGIGVILDWVPAHFPRDAYALAQFDGSHLYEHADPRQGEHKDWGTLVFNYSRAEVRTFLLSNAVFWLDRYHIDGLRVDAVASMLYLDYSRNAGEWVPNEFGGRENLHAVSLLKRLNEVVTAEFPGVVTIAEESTSWPGVSRPVWTGGLGFTFKWNMGWMHDSLKYMQTDPVFRRYHHDKLTFSLLYAFTENFMLVLSHDEVVHLKKSLLTKMPGDDWQQFANLRTLFGYMWAHPGKKLVFMGGDTGQRTEWNHDATVQWPLEGDERALGLQRLVRDLNRLYREQPALHRLDHESAGFQWVDCNDVDHSVVTFLRFSGDSPADYVLVVCNFTPMPRHDYRVGVPGAGFHREILNTDSVFYGGSNVGNDGGQQAQPVATHGQPWSLSLDLPPLGVMFFRVDPT
ncbi:MAG: 1,4-alpha-glucan branching protein GlgB [Myxococcota bacterium]